MPVYLTSSHNYPYISSASNESSNLLSGLSSTDWPYSSGITNNPTSAYQPTENFWQHTNPYPALPSNLGQDTDLNNAIQPHAVPQTGATSARNRSGASNYLGSRPVIQRRNMQDYPSPQLSDVSGPVNPTYPAFGPRMMTSPSMPLVKSPSISGSSISRRSLNLDREPLRNEAGAFSCDHANCAKNPPVFPRKCEWRQVLHTN